MVDCPGLSLNSRKVIRKYLVHAEVNCEYEQVNTQWRMTKYNEGGHFLEHCDREKQLDDYVHFGT